MQQSPLDDDAAFQDAYDLLSAIIGAYSTLIARARSVEEAERLRAERQPYLRERAGLRVSDRETVARIRADYPALLRAKRGEG